MNYYTDAFRHYADFGGRATRSQFWVFALINTLVGCLSLILAALAMATHNSVPSPPVAFTDGTHSMESSSMGVDTFYLGLLLLSGLYQLAVLIPGHSLAVRRLHDIGKSGWSLMWAFIPLIGSILLIVWLCRDSDPDNRYGPNPKASEGLG